MEKTKDYDNGNNLKDELLRTAKRLELVKPTTSGNYIFAAEPGDKFIESLWNRIKQTGVRAFNYNYWQKYDTTEQYNAYPYIGVALTKIVRGEGLWLCGVDDLIDSFDTFHGDCGAIISYVGKNPCYKFEECPELVKPVVERAIKEKWESPLIVPFKDLDYKISPRERRRVEFEVVENPKGIIFGTEAKRILRIKRDCGFDLNNYDIGPEFDGMASMGRIEAHDGLIGAYTHSGDECDPLDEMILGEASREELTNAINSKAERIYLSQIRRYQIEKAITIRSFWDVEKNHKIEGKEK